jgi:hypothetical protein
LGGFEEVVSPPVAVLRRQTHPAMLSAARPSTPRFIQRLVLDVWPLASSNWRYVSAVSRESGGRWCLRRSGAGIQRLM